MRETKYFLTLLIIPVLLLCFFTGCDDECTEEPMTPPVLGASSTGHIESASDHWSGQKERSSENFSTKGMGPGTSILWNAPEGVSFDIKIDKTAATDPFYANGVKDGTITPYTSESKLYIANPKGAEGTFTVYFKVFTPEDDAIYIWSAKDKLSGQNHRASTNFHFNAPALYKVECPEGITFNIYEDVSGGSDNLRYRSLKNGTIIHKSHDNNLYIADASGASEPFTIGLIPVVYPWMTALSDDLPVTALSIPGTHDSGTMDANTAYSTCQHFSISDQLYNGIRFFDIRLNSDLDIVHGPSGTSYDFDLVLKEMNNFLAKYPGEMILMRVKEEKGSIAEPIKSYFGDKSKADYVKNIIRNTTLGTLGSCRGKIVMLRDFPNPDSSQDWGVYLTDGWPSDGVAQYVNEDNVGLYVEDRYFSASETTHDTVEKIGLVKDAINDANNNEEYKDYLFLIFNSIATRGVTTPWDYAWGGNTADRPMNPALSNLLKNSVENEPKPFRTGIVILDFYCRNGYDDDTWLAERIINLNFTTPLIPVPTISEK